MKKALKYVISLIVAIILLWFAFDGLQWQTFMKKIEDINYLWLILSGLFALLSHIIRAYRWNALIEPLGYRLTTFRTFLAVMIGYFTNLFVPRMGEISRCGVLKKLERVPVSSSLGTVVAERVVDVLCLGILFSVVIVTEFGLLKSYLFEIAEGTVLTIGQNLFWIYLMAGVLLGIGIIAFILIRVFNARLKKSPLYNKIRHNLSKLLSGASTFKRVKSKPKFILASVLIWVLYFYMSYIVFFAFPATENLNFWVGMTVLVMGGLGMAAPVQGGFGTYHVLVSSILLAYGVPKEDGIVLATIIHATQTLSVIIFGGAAFIIATMVSRRDSMKTEPYGTNPGGFVKQITSFELTGDSKQKAK